MPNIVIPNLRYPATSESFYAIWKLTRALKAAGWRYKGSADASNKDAGTFNPSNDKWGGGTQVGTQTATGAFNIGSPTSTKEMGRVTISGGTLVKFSAIGGISGSGSVGRYLKITGATNAANNGTWQIVNVNSATSVDVVNPAAVAETTPGSATWTELDALLDTYPAILAGSLAGGSWWCGQGPSTLKIPIGANFPSTNFFRNEQVTQAATGATGEVLGVVTDSGGNGFMVVAPRNSGSGAGQRGWSNTDPIAAASVPSGSGASVTPTGAAIEYGTEIVIWKYNQLLGHIYFQCVDLVNESAVTANNGRFSIMASLAGCTATVCPGGATGAPTVNGFPVTGTFVGIGTGGSGLYSTGSTAWRGNTQTSVLLLSHLMVTNAIETVGQSGDGTFTWAEGTANNGTYQTYEGFAYLRCDDQEDGDVWPFVFCVECNLETYTGSTRTAVTQYAGASPADFFTLAVFLSNYTVFKGWRCRGFASGDAWQQFAAASQLISNQSVVGANFYQSADQTACSFVQSLAREPIWVVSTQVSQKMRKGTIRWWYTVLGGAGNNLHQNKMYVQLSSNYGPIVVGPWDGVTIPFNS